MFLARETGWSHDMLMDMSIRDVHYWTVEAVKLHNDMNKTD